MKFILGSAGLEPIKQASSNIILDKYNQFADWAVSKEVELVLAPLGAFLKAAAINAWHWFIINLPNIMMYSAVGAGILIILSAMAGRGVIKPLGYYIGALILATCILGGV